MTGAGSERGSGSVLAVALIGATMAVTVLSVPLLAVLAVGQSVQNAADAAALAAADTASGAVAGVPCTAAAEAAGLNGASVVSCAVDGLIASVTVASSALGFDLSSSARAGPPPRREPAEGTLKHAFSAHDCSFAVVVEAVQSKSASR